MQTRPCRSCGTNTWPNRTRTDATGTVSTASSRRRWPPTGPRSPQKLVRSWRVSILDSHYDASKNLILAHAALGAHNPKGLSLGIFGSHLTYAWPRFMEEIASCLTDVTPPGDRVGNDNGECVSLWEACAVGQGAFLHEVGHAFSAPHTTGIMSRGYSPDWPKSFLSRTARCVARQTDGVAPVIGDTQHDCHWDARDILRFYNLAHFRHPKDALLASESPTFSLEDDEDFPRLTIACPSGIARVYLNGIPEEVASVRKPAPSVQYTLAELEARFDSKKPLVLEAMGLNGREHSADVWRLFSSKSWIRVPGTGIRLEKQSVGDDGDANDTWHWAVMLKKRGQDGSLVPASKIDLRVGCGLDGAVVYYKDGTKVPCGPRGKHGQDPHMGGHQAKKIAIRKGIDVVKVAVTCGSYHNDLCGLRMWLSDGRAMGALNKRDGYEVKVLGRSTNRHRRGFLS